MVIEMDDFDDDINIAQISMMIPMHSDDDDQDEEGAESIDIHEVTNDDDDDMKLPPTATSYFSLS